MKFMEKSEDHEKGFQRVWGKVVTCLGASLGEGSKLVGASLWGASVGASWRQGWVNFGARLGHVW